ncbi:MULTISPECIES: Crp/Fnr family transcriptional regulator [Pseudomonas]|uniref:Putative cAMP-dependent protein kinase n=1 Tax=Pseudomonas fluorescens (strain Pf0-1) TaxID=205922 RepID=Q3K6S1_PSEPF|nr:MULTISPECIES: cyclic nucleotide-binding domain-containing protein [Pseudomonas]ABA76533.1 putative cAMP-dependent protein kinase [Pseudomonas fluorescens Pf0-1]MBL0799021.1 cyclic nucleotide-binding domain-containing protein [Pseudomonas sp. B7]MBX8625025.1 cyclic nucleotide-binding domain-containing protein [Pseudomonas glycinae]MBY9026463.1 cyclic nucleotide-binding domain-containing protein [Pseudomonas fluorescens]MBY9031618.1 cyclic nucleotide-binding domain-containing protein [Pseudom
MYLLGEQSAQADALINHLQSLPAQWLEGLVPCGPALELEATDDLLARLPDDQLFLLTQGVITGRLDGRGLFYWHEGDLIGLQQGPEWADCTLYSDNPLTLLPYRRSDLFQHVYGETSRSEQFLRYLLGQMALLAHAVAEFKPREFRSTNGFKRVDAGDILIREGDDADHVFVIIEGHAEAFVNGHKVGDVPKDEIFGAMAVFTGEPRNATVIAREASTVMLIPGDQFLSMTRTNPKIAHSLIESMALRIDQLNKQLTGFNSQT